MLLRHCKHLLVVVYRFLSRISCPVPLHEDPLGTPSPPTKSFDFRGFDSSKLLILKGGNSHVRWIWWGLPESLTQGLLVGGLLVGGLGVFVHSQAANVKCHASWQSRALTRGAHFCAPVHDDCTVQPSGKRQKVEPEEKVKGQAWQKSKVRSQANKSPHSIWWQ